MLHAECLDDEQMFKATHKIADHSVIKHTTKKVDPFLVIAAICTAINSALRLNMLAIIEARRKEYD